MRNAILDPKPNDLDIDTNPYTVGVKLCVANTISMISYFGSMAYIILSMVFLVYFSWMRNACEEQRNLWLYLCLCQISLVVSVITNMIIEKISSAKIYLISIRNVGIIIVSLAFASYGSGVLSKATETNVRKHCTKDTPTHFDNLVLASMILSWIVFLYYIIRAFGLMVFGFQWLTKKPQYVHLDDQQHHHHDPELILGKHKTHRDDDNDKNDNGDDSKTNQDRKHDENGNNGSNDNTKMPKNQFRNKRTLFGDRIWDNEYHSDVTDEEEFHNQEHQKIQAEKKKIQDRRHTVQFINSQDQELYKQNTANIKPPLEEEDDQDNIELGINQQQQQYINSKLGNKNKPKTSLQDANIAPTIHSGMLTRRNVNNNE